MQEKIITSRVSNSFLGVLFLPPTTSLHLFFHLHSMAHRFLLGIFRWKDNSRNKLQYQHQQKLTKRTDKIRRKMAACFPRNKNGKIIRWSTCISLSTMATITSCTYPHCVCGPCYSWWLQWFIYHSMNKPPLHYKNSCTGWKGFLKNTYKHKLSLQVITQHEYPILVKRIIATQWRLAPKSQLKNAVLPLDIFLIIKK